MKYYESPSEDFDNFLLCFLFFLFFFGGDGDLSESELSEDDELLSLDELDDELEEPPDDEESLSLDLNNE